MNNISIEEEARNRLSIYIKMLEYTVKDKGFNAGLCTSLRYAVSQLNINCIGIKLENLPELMIYKPKNERKDCLWWPLSEYGNRKRREALKDAMYDTSRLLTRLDILKEKENFKKSVSEPQYRLEIYQKLLSIIEKIPLNSIFMGLCHNLESITLSEDAILYLPELLACKPINANNGDYWWDIDNKGRNKRINAIKKAIKTIKKLIKDDTSSKQVQ